MDPARTTQTLQRISSHGMKKQNLKLKQRRDIGLTLFFVNPNDPGLNQKVAGS